LTLFEPVRVVAGFEDIAVMREPIEQGGGHLGIAEDLHPVAKAEIGRKKPSSNKLNKVATPAKQVA